jgi:hypothetical protein
MIELYQSTSLRLSSFIISANQIKEIFYFKLSIIFLVSSRLNALRVVIRTFPKAPDESDTDIANSSLGNSAVITASYFPNV